MTLETLENCLANDRKASGDEVEGKERRESLLLNRSFSKVTGARQKIYLCGKGMSYSAMTAACCCFSSKSAMRYKLFFSEGKEDDQCGEGGGTCLGWHIP